MFPSITHIVISGYTFLFKAKEVWRGIFFRTHIIYFSNFKSYLSYKLSIQHITSSSLHPRLAKVVFLTCFFFKPDFHKIQILYFLYRIIIKNIKSIFYKMLRHLEHFNSIKYFHFCLYHYLHLKLPSLDNIPNIISHFPICKPLYTIQYIILLYCMLSHLY